VNPKIIRLAIEALLLILKLIWPKVSASMEEGAREALERWVQIIFKAAKRIEKEIAPEKKVEKETEENIK
jgi:hypothetical protein